MVCDFCSSENVVCVFTIPEGGITETMLVEPGQPTQIVTHVDDGQWAACEACRDDILKAVKSDMHPVVELSVLQEVMIDVAMRSYENFKRRVPDMPDPLVAISIADMHAIFWTRYQGTAPVPVNA